MSQHLRTAQLRDNCGVVQFNSYNIFQEQQARFRLVGHFTNLSAHTVPFEQRMHLIEATMRMLSDLPIDELFRLDQQYFPEHYI